jgi:Glycosyl transferase 4-like domain
VARWPLSRMDSDAAAEAEGEFIDLTTRLGRREAELRSVRADQSELRRQLIRAEDRANKLRWQLDSIHASRAYRAFQLLRAARRHPAAVPRLPAALLRVLTSAGQRPSARPDPDFRGREEHTLAGWAAYDRHDYEAAMAEAQAILGIFPDDYPALDLMQSAHWQRGDIELTLVTLRRMRAVHDSPRLAATVRGYVGQVRELDPRWQPRIPGAPHPVEPRDGVIMHLLGESVPQRVNGFTTSSRSALWCQRQAGLDPFVVTSLGFPRTAAVSRFAPVEVMESVEVVEGTPYYRIDPGADYPAAQPRDILLTDTAWLAARIGRQQRPAVIHARTSAQGFETALVGLALREHLRRPLVCEVRSFHDAAGGDTEQAGPGERGGPSDGGSRGELRASRLATEIRCLQRADLVVTNTDQMRSAVVAGGVPASQVRVIPDAVDAVATLLDHPEQARRLADSGRQWVLAERTGAAHGQLYQDVYRELLDRWPPARPPEGQARETT